MNTANEVRGEVDLVLEGERFVLRPSYGAIIEVEALTGKGLVDLAGMAQDGKLPLGDSARIVTCLVKAWGKATDNRTAQGVNAERMGELIQEYGLMQVQLRLALVLGLAATGGCLADGTLREGEMTATGMTSATPAASSQD